MYTHSGSFEAQRYGELYGFDPNASKRDLRRQGRQFKRYLKTDAADYDRQMFDVAEQARRAGDMRARSEGLTQTLAAGMLTPLQIDTTGAMERMNAGFETTDARRAELAEQDLNNRITGAARFNDAFRTARQAGLKTFTWRGNLYGTELAQPGSGAGKGNATPATPAAPTPTTPAPAPAPAPAPTGGRWREVTPAEFDYTGFQKKYGLKEEIIGGAKYLRYDPAGIGDFYIDQQGRVRMAPTTGVVSAPLNSPADTPLGGAQRQNAEATLRMVSDYRKGRAGDARDYDPIGVAVGWRKFGGRLNRINYFQQGGAMQQDMMSQVQALVQAAAQGDEQATQQITQIMEAAKAGDQQAMQIAQIIQKVIEQMQGQATSAKWGAKVGYIKSLKFAKGGKTCPACEKKVEMKACGGKKAKKRYFED